MKLRYSLFLLMSVWAAPALGQGGVNLAWNDCGTSGQLVKSFACNSNVGVHLLYTSFVSPQPLTQVNGIEVTVDMAFPQPTVPNWWMAQSSSPCRPNAITANVHFLAGPNSCADPWQGAAVGGAAIQPGYPFPDRARIRAVAALPLGTFATVDDVTEYYAVAIQISNARTVGTGSCSGCEVPACMLLTSIELNQPVGVGNYFISQPLDNWLVGWQCSAGIGHGGCFFAPPCVTPAKAPTWGAVKGLYR